MTTTFQRRIQKDEEELALLEKQLREQAPAEGQEEEQQEDQVTQPDPVVETVSTEETPAGGTNWEKRYADLRSHTAKKEKEAKAELDALRTEIAELRSTTAIPATEMPQTQKELAEWREKNPQAARILQALIEEEAEKKFESAKLDLDEIKKDRARLAREKAEAKIRSVHEDFDVLKDSDDFHDWIETRPKVIQDAVYKNNNDPESVIGVIDLYKAAKGIGKPKPKATAADAVTVKGGKATIDPEAGKPQPIKESWVASLSMRDYEKNAEKIEEAIRSGNFIYDMSKRVVR
jgi:hypothetical protein